MASGRSWSLIAGEGLGEYGPCERARRVRKWSQVRLAGVAGVSTAVVLELEAGRIAGMRVESLMRVATAMGISVLDLVPGLGQRHYTGDGVVRWSAPRGGGLRRSERMVELMAAMRALLEREGGSMRVGDVIRVLGAQHGASINMVKRAKEELGVLSVRSPGWGNGWEWTLPPASSDQAG